MGNLTGPMCSTRCGPGWIDDGTLCLTKTYPWGPIGVKSSRKTIGAVKSSTPLEELLQEGAEKLQGIAFGHPIRKDRFDKKFWLAGYWKYEGEIDYFLMLKEGGLPSDAFNALFNKKSQALWTLDCAFFVQAVLLYCLLRRHGAEGFDKLLEKDRVNTKGRIMFRQHRSTGLIFKPGTYKELPKIIRGSKANVSKDEGDNAVKSTAIGSVVVFTNMDAPEESGYRNENTIKLEADLFIAHGIEHQSAFVNRSEIERKLIQVAVEHNSQLANVKQVVSVTYITEYKI